MCLESKIEHLQPDIKTWLQQMTCFFFPQPLKTSKDNQYYNYVVERKDLCVKRYNKTNPLFFNHLLNCHVSFSSFFTRRHCRDTTQRVQITWYIMNTNVAEQGTTVPVKCKFPVLTRNSLLGVWCLRSRISRLKFRVSGIEFWVSRCSYIFLRK